MEQNPAVPLTPKTNWWQGNWKWFVPVGCFSMLLLFVAFVVSIALIVFSAVKATDVYKDALARAKATFSVIQMLGSPIKEGFLVSGNTNVNGASGEAEPVHPYLRSERKGNDLRGGNKSLGEWTIRVSLWKSKKRMSESTFFAAVLQQIRPDHSRAIPDKETFRQRNSFRNSCRDCRYWRGTISRLRVRRGSRCRVSRL